tara:strand:+ start:7260 stop:9272 length:2013 start_codon:yes stop_codon:yes gene_type:complete
MKTMNAKPSNLCFLMLLFIGGILLNPAQITAQKTDVPDDSLKLVIKPDTLIMTVNEISKLDFKFVDSNGDEFKRDLAFFSGLPGSGIGGTSTEKLSVDAEGNVKAFSPGSYVIMAWPTTSNVGLTVIPVIVKPLPVSTVSLKNLPTNFYSNTSYWLEVNALDAKGNSRSDAKAIFKSLNPEIATVSSKGLLYAKKEGSVEITVETEGIIKKTKVKIEENPVAEIELTANKTEVKTGEVVHLRAILKDKKGKSLNATIPITYSFSGSTQDNSGTSGLGLIEEDGRFVANRPGSFILIAKAGNISQETHIEAVPRNAKGSITVAGHGPIGVNMSDLWIWEGIDGRDYAVTGTHSANGEAYFWDVTNPAEMRIIDTVTVDARTVNDVKISADGRIGVLSREGASNRKNGIVILDVSDPFNVEIISTFDDGLSGGVHNVFIYEDHVYATNNVQKYDIINIEDPKNPYRVSQFELSRPGHVVHDVWIEDGIAYSSNFGDGLAVVDIGSNNSELGGIGGSPENPKQLASHNFENGWNHAAFPFKSKSTGDFYVVAGDEAFPGGEPAGWFHFVKFDDWNNSKEVARYEVPEAGSHNLWVKDDVLYAGYYDGGLRVVDISGELMGNLYDQGREIGFFQPKDPKGKNPTTTMTWGAMPYKEYVFIADLASGLWALKVNR